MTENMFTNNKKSLKIQKGLSESVNRRTNNTMTKGKPTSNNLQINTQQTTKDREPLIPLGTGDDAPEE